MWKLMTQIYKDDEVEKPTFTEFYLFPQVNLEHPFKKF